jgi:hypothetical protein
MITLYSDKSSLKKKLTVMVIWFVALVLVFLLVKIIAHEGTSFLTKVLPVIIGLFMIAGILLRCKIARGFTLVALYFLALFPLIVNFLLDSSFILFSANKDALFSQLEVLITNIVWGLLFIIPIYFFSNNKSMEIFYIESNPKEHIFFLLGAIGLIILYAQLFL